MMSEQWLSAIKVIVFDMDGTLYQEDTYMERYIRYLLEETDHELEADAAVHVGKAIRSGVHPFQFGHFYHMQDDMVLVRQDGAFVHGLSWEGAALADLDGRLSHESMSDLIHIGDPWCIAAVIAHKYRIPEQKLKQAFQRVRKEMICEPYRFPFRSELFQALEELDAVERKVVMTNTYLESGLEFLHYMQIHHVFDEVHCGAEKPDGIARYMESLIQQGYQPHEILSIGDNTWNDLHPVKRLGGRTCFISPYKSVDTETWDLRLTTLEELEMLLLSIQQVKRNAVTSPVEYTSEANFAAK
ncbi:HAD family hydrolase [Paenibacillus mendelii]|uniref:HAD family hydrolase n=1 Tax=Paenibacillus mendelii TaxID=206163 RepID=A0ABV6JFJ5_9BACL|nr:HAD hydrolase-like protein [Paenibacillus mendelii]MCQ6557521.1 HAD hydrolase-like protein [Paenibacillus mendelii]